MKLKKNQIIQITVEEMAFGGKGIAKYTSEESTPDEKPFVIFIPHALKGQKVEIILTKLKKNYAEARLIKVLERSPVEVPNEFQPIAGAPYISLPIDLQKNIKEKSSQDLLQRFGKIDNWEEIYDEYIESPSHFHYRNKVEYSFSSILFDKKNNKFIDGFALGFKPLGVWWAVDALYKETGLFDSMVEKEILNISKYFAQTGLPAWNPKKKTGFFKTLMIRKSFTHNTFLIALTTTSESIENFDNQKCIDFFSTIFPKDKFGFFHLVNDDLGDRWIDLDTPVNHQFGLTELYEKVCGVEFKIGLGSFFQTNTQAAEKLYNKVAEYAGEIDFEENDGILDCFCGAGTISQILAKKIKTRKIIGVDIVKQAILDAQDNAETNDLSYINYVCQDMGKWLNQKVSNPFKIKLLVLDPPRAGLAPKTLHKILALDLPNLIYVSCNPSTFARDCEQICMQGYELKKLSLLDQFPHTAHVESISFFQKK